MSKTIASTSSKASRQFRILALPLARLPRPLPPTPPPSASTPPKVPDVDSHDATEASKQPKTPLMLFHVSQPDASPESGPPSLAKRALDKASDMWLKLGEKDKKSVSYWFYKKGEGLMDKIEYEEWALKAVQEGRGVKVAEKGKEQEQERIEIPLLKPTFDDQPLPTLLPKLHRFLIHRIPYHRKLMWRSLIASPLTWPFAIIPIIPNFPMFYVLWRAWSHYKAWRGALYLEQLLKLGMIVEQPSEQLQEVYNAHGVVIPPPEIENRAPDNTTSEGVKKGTETGGGYTTNTQVIKQGDEMVEQAKGETGAPDGTATPEAMVFKSKPQAEKVEDSLETPAPRHPSLLLAPNQVALLAKTFDLGALEIIDINRAVEQAEMRAKEVDKSNAEKKGGEDKSDEKSTEWRGNLHR